MKRIVLLCVVLITFGGLVGALPPMSEQIQQKAAAAKEAAARNQQALRTYSWITKTALTEPPAPKKQRGLKGKMVAKKTAEMKQKLEASAALVQSYVPPAPEKLQAAIAAGKVSISPGADTNTIRFTDYEKAGDSMTLALDSKAKSLRQVTVDTWLDKPENKVALQVSFQTLPDGTNYAASTVLSIPKDKLEVRIENSNYQKVAAPSAGAGSQAQQAPFGTQSPTPSAQASAQQSQPPPGGQQIPPEQLDKLLAPIALYPDALIGQILNCSLSPFQVSALSDWLSANSNLKGSEVQEAAQKDGFDPSFVALAVFPQVVNMMAQQLDWMKQLGQAFRSDRKGVFDSIQYLRKQAQEVGNLVSTPQQEVQTVTTDSGQQVIVIQPANPQVIYVPQYNPQVVYVSPPPQPAPATTTVVVQESSGSNEAAAALIGFTAGVIIGAAASDNYYYGPYSWRGGAGMYNEAREDYYDHRENMAEDRYDHRENMSEDRYDNRENTTENRQQNTSERQGNRDENVNQRQTTQGQNQASREGTRSENQSSRSSAQSSRQESASSRSSSYSSRGYGESGGSSRSSAFSGYGSGSREQAASSRGQSSRSSSQRSRRR